MHHPQYLKSARWLDDDDDDDDENEARTTTSRTQALTQHCVLEEEACLVELLEEIQDHQ